MVQPSFVLSQYVKKNDKEKRRRNFRQTNMRYLVVVLAVLVVFSCEYCFDNPSALQLVIQDNYKEETKEKLDEFTFNLLYALYAFPNVVIPLLGGILIDRIGARIVLIIAASFCVLGQMIFGVGGNENLFSVMLVGRIVFGVGGEVLHASQNTLISNWFKANELSLVLGICISFPKLGSAMNSYVSPALSKTFEERDPEGYLNVAGPIFIGLIFMGISLGLAVVLAWIDRRTERLERIKHESALLASRQSSSGQLVIGTSKKDRSSAQKSVQIEQIDSLKAEMKETAEGGEHIKLSDITKLPITFWLIILIAMLSQALFIPFLDNANKYYVDVFKGVEDPEDASIYLVLPYCVSSLFVPLMGYFVDKVSKRSFVLIASCCFFTLTYFFMMLLEANVDLRTIAFFRWVPSFLLGICIAIFCAIIVPTIPMLISPRLLGTGFGIMEMLQNLALGVFPLLAGYLRETKDTQLQGFHFQTQFFFLISCICTSASLFLKAADSLTGNKLDIKDFRKIYIKKVLQQDVPGDE